MEYLLFRPPRRQPRVLAVSSQSNKLALVVSDPWELRYISENSLPMKSDKRLDQCQVLIQETIIRERPQVLVVIASRSTARRAMKLLARHFGLPLVELPPKRWQSFLSIMKKGSKAMLKIFLEALPARHVSKRLFKNKLLLKTAVLAHAALSILLKNAYETQSKTNKRKPWYQALDQVAGQVQAGKSQSAAKRKPDNKSKSGNLGKRKSDRPSGCTEDVRTDENRAGTGKKRG